MIRMLFIALLLSGCQRTQWLTVCPTPVVYDQRTEHHLAQELQTLPQHSTIVQFLLDYKKERDMLKACRP